jgi:hypothetical protein
VSDAGAAAKPPAKPRTPEPEGEEPEVAEAEEHPDLKHEPRVVQLLGRRADRADDAERPEKRATDPPRDAVGSRRL